MPYLILAINLFPQKSLGTVFMLTKGLLYLSKCTLVKGLGCPMSV